MLAPHFVPQFLEPARTFEVAFFRKNVDVLAAHPQTTGAHRGEPCHESPIVLKKHSRSGSSPLMTAERVKAASRTMSLPCSTSVSIGNPRRRKRRCTDCQFRIFAATSIQSPSSHPSQRKVASVSVRESVVSTAAERVGGPPWSSETSVPDVPN